MQTTLTATPSTASSEMASSALTLLEAVDLATVTLVAPWSRRLVARPLETSGPRSELCPSEHLLDVRLACLQDSPGPSTTLTREPSDQSAFTIPRRETMSRPPLRRTR